MKQDSGADAPPALESDHHAAHNYFLDTHAAHAAQTAASGEFTSYSDPHTRSRTRRGGYRPRADHSPARANDSATPGNHFPQQGNDSPQHRNDSPQPENHSPQQENGSPQHHRSSPPQGSQRPGRESEWPHGWCRCPGAGRTVGGELGERYVNGTITLRAGEDRGVSTHRGASGPVCSRAYRGGW